MPPRNIPSTADAAPAGKKRKRKAAGAPEPPPPTPPPRRPLPLDRSQVLLSCKALVSYLARSADRPAPPAGSPAPVWLAVTTPPIPDFVVPKPSLVRVPRPVFAFGGASGGAPFPQAAAAAAAACVVVRDKSWADALRAEGVLGRYAATVVTLPKLKAMRREERERLAVEHDVFFAADPGAFRTAALVAGRTLAEKKRALFPVRLKQGELKKAIKDVCRSTLVHLSHGGCTSVRIGHAGMTADELAENVAAAAEGVVAQVPGGWRRVNALHLRSGRSLPVPVYVRRDRAEGSGGEDKAEGPEAKRPRNRA